jgi:RNA polymerase sigma-70 factor (ECF subfamily)
MTSRSTAPPYSSEELARQAQAGSREAFGQLVERHEASIHGFLRVLAPDAAEAEDLAQEAFVRAWQRIGDFDPTRRFSTWLFTIAKRRAIDFVRRRRPHTVEAELPERVDPAPEPSSGLESTEERENLWRLARRVLSVEQLTALWLRYSEDLSGQEIARVLDRREATVRVILHRARARLAEHVRAKAHARRSPVPPVQSLVPDRALGGR